MNMTTIKTRVVHNIDFAAKWYQFANWAEPSIKQVSTAANQKDQKYQRSLFLFPFLRARASRGSRLTTHRATFVGSL